MNPLTLEAINDHCRELREGPRSISSRFRLRCTHCLNLVDRSLKVGDPCPLNNGHCSGVLEANPAYKP